MIDLFRFWILDLDLHAAIKYITMDRIKRSSQRLAGKRRREEVVALNRQECYRPKATDSAMEQDCGILPSE